MNSMRQKKRPAGEVGQPPEPVESRRPAGWGATWASELGKWWTLPAQRMLALVAIGLGVCTALICYPTLQVTQQRTLAELDVSEVLSVGLVGVDITTMALIVLAAISVGGEYATGMIEMTLLLTPSRSRVLAVRLGVLGSVALVVGLLTAICCLLAGLAFGASVGWTPAEVLAAGGWRRVLGAVLMPLFYAVLAACGAFIFRGSGLGMVTAVAVLGLAGLVRLAGGQVEQTVMPLLPMAALHSLAGHAEGTARIGAFSGAVSLVIWLAVAIGVAWWCLVRKDA